MATANSSVLEKLSWYTDHCTHTVWDAFSADQKQQMVEEDLSAGTSVSMVLVSLITTGMVLCMITLLVVLAWPV